MPTYIDVTPTWSALLPAMLAVIRNPDAPVEAVQNIEAQMARMAQAADLWNQHVREGQEPEEETLTQPIDTDPDTADLPEFTDSYEQHTD